ncbi:MAG: hypothetical protein M1823_002415 [Watsoniomyces obsoletus]|nr:MAG: hypothetical protein M1823_002415 [Watsoniomyces obsoletus]
MQDEIQEICNLSDTILNPTDSGSVREYMTRRKILISEISKTIKRCKEILREKRLKTNEIISEREFLQANQDFDKVDKKLSQEFFILSLESVRIEYNILAARPLLSSSSSRPRGIGRAYRNVMVGRLNSLIQEDFEKKEEERRWDYKYEEENGRTGEDMWVFRTRLSRAYFPLSAAAPESFKKKKKKGKKEKKGQLVGWCPIFKEFFDRYNCGCHLLHIHIVPRIFGGIPASYIFGENVGSAFRYGVDATPGGGGGGGRGHEVIWNVGNGLMLERSLGQWFEDGKLIIVPSLEEGKSEGEDAREFKMIVLDEKLLKRRWGDDGNGNGKLWVKDLNHQRLVFKTDERPCLKNLWLHYVLSLLRRRKANFKGWEKEVEKVSCEKYWGKIPGKWLRRSFVRALALEIADTYDVVDLITGDGEGLTDDFPGQLSDEEEREMANAVRVGLDGFYDEEEWGGEEEEEEEEEESESESESENE